MGAARAAIGVFVRAGFSRGAQAGPGVKIAKMVRFLWGAGESIPIKLGLACGPPKVANIANF